MNISVKMDYSGLSAALQARVQKIINRTMKILEGVARKSVAEFMPIHRRRIEELFKEAVESFYNAYSPVYYSRTDSLFDVLEVDIDSESYEIILHGDRISSSNGTMNGDGLYQLVFKQGNHGGAVSGVGHPSPGVPYWRAPHPYYWYWSQPAIQTQAPYDLFVQKYNTYKAGELHEILQGILSKNMRGAI